MRKRVRILIISALILILAFFSFLFYQADIAKAALTGLQLSELPAKVAKEAGHSTTVTAYDGGAVMTSYNGTVHFSATDHTVTTDNLPATLPSNYTFKDGSKEKAMTVNGDDPTLVAKDYSGLITKLKNNDIKKAYVGVFETTATGTQNGNLFIENDYHFDSGTTISEHPYNLTALIAEASTDVDVYAWITVFGPESTIDVGGVTYKTWVDPASTQHQTYINNLITHLLTNYSGLKGIVIDYIRYADAEATEKYRVYQDGGTYTDYTGNFAPGNATDIIFNAVDSYKTTVTGLGKELAAEVYSASDDSTYNNWVTADLGQDYAKMATKLDFIIPMAYHVGYHGPQWVSEVVDYVHSKTLGSPSCGVIPHVQTYQDGKDIEWPGASEIAAATDPIDYAKVEGLAFYAYEDTSDGEWTEVKDSFDDNGVKTFSGELLFGSTGTYNLKVEDETAHISDTQAGIEVFNGHPDGSLLMTSGDPAVWFIQDGYKSVILSLSVFDSRFEWNQIVVVPSSELNNYPTSSGEPYLHYQEGTLFRLYSAATVYAVEDGQKRAIDSIATFDSKGYNWSNIILAESQAILDAHTTGANITSGSTLPNGTLIKEASSSTVYFLEAGARKTIPSVTVFNSQFRWQDIVFVDLSTMESFTPGTNMYYRKGSIVKESSGTAIYYVEYQRKRVFPSGMFYIGEGYSWDDFVTAESTSILDYYATANQMYLLPKYIDIIGDTQRNPTMYQTLAALMTNDRPYLIFHTGDVTTYCTSSEWAGWDSAFGYLKSYTRYYAALGNHDAGCSGFDSRFGTTYWWSKDVDNIHFIILDTEASLASGSEQYNWLANDLSHQPATTRFTLVFFHQPPYMLGGLADAVALFVANRVDVVFNGHIHCYERAITTGITYIINGRGGAWPLINPCHNTGDTQHYESSYGYVRLLLNNNQLELRAYNDSGTLVDSADLAGI